MIPKLYTFLFFSYQQIFGLLFTRKDIEHV